MKQQTISALVIALLNNLVESSKVLILNDIHLNKDSNEGVSMPGSEASPQLLEYILQDAFDAEAYSGLNYDAILCIGDLVRHGLAVDESSATNNWEVQKQTMREVLEKITEIFVDVPILPVIGNNDVTYHN